MSGNISARSARQCAAGIVLGLCLGVCSLFAAPPSISSQPQNQTARLGANASFSVTASGSGTLTYRWSFNGTNLSNSSHLSGATNATLTLSNVTAADAGNYRVAITNSQGFAISSNAALTVLLPPVIGSVTPPSALVSRFVTLSGTNFSTNAASNVVFFGATRATVLSASTTNLSVAVPAGALYGPITVTVNGLMGFSVAPFQPMFFGYGVPVSSSTLGGYFTLPGGSGSHRTAIADLDGDGYPDLAIANVYGNTISLFRNLSTPASIGTLTSNTFAPRVDFPAIAGGTDNPYGFIAADVDGDGKPDLVFADRVGNNVGVYRNISTPGSLTTNSFAAPVYFPTGIDPRYVRVRDLDGDGRPDIVACDYAANTISILRNVGAAGSLSTSSFAPKVDLPAGSGTYDVAIQDLDGDGKPDLAIVNSSSTTISLYRNNSTPGAISFELRVDLPALASNAYIIAGDIDGDGKPELIAGGQANQVCVYRNLASAGSLTTNSFAPSINYATPSWVHTLALGDMNGDGKPDIVVVGELPSYLTLFQNTSTPGSISLGSQVGFTTGYNAWGVSVGDLDGDSRPDVTFCNAYDNTVSVYQNLTLFGTAPNITSHPASQTVAVGSTINLSAGANGTQISYQWLFNGIPLTDGGRVSGSTNSVLTISNAQTNDSGTYRLVVSNILAAVTSSNAVVSVLQPPALTLEPADQIVAAGSSVTLTSFATGSAPLGFQWLFNGTNLPGATASNLFIASAKFFDQGNYSIFVSNAIGTATSSNAFLTVNTPPIITSQPQSVTAAEGAAFSFKVVAIGSLPISYQWKYNGAPIPNATNASLPITAVQPAQAGGYSVQITNQFGVTNSITVVLSVPPSAPIILQQPQSQFVPPGLGVDANFSVSVVGTTPYFFQWMLNGTNIPGANSASLTVTNVLTTNSGNYSVLITNSVGQALSVDAALSTIPGSHSIPQSLSLTYLADYVYDRPRDIIYIATGYSDIQRFHISSNIFLPPIAITGTLTSLDLSPDGNMLAVGDQSYGGTNSWIWLADLQSNTVRQVLFDRPAPEAGIFSVAFGNDGAVLSSASFGSSASGSVRLRRYDPATDTTTVPNLVERSSPLTASGDGSFIAIVDTDDSFGVVSIYNVALRGIWGSVRAANYVSAPAGLSRDGKQIAQPSSGSLLVFTNRGTIFWDPNSYLTTISPGSAVVYHPALDLMFVGVGGSPEIRAYDTTTFTETGRFDFGAQLSSARLRFSRDGARLFGAVPGGLRWLDWTNTAPTFAIQPVSQTIATGSNVTFSALAFGKPPIKYQWQLNGISLPDATNATLVLSNVPFSIPANYSVIAYNPFGYVISTNATLTVNSKPFITSQPASQSVGAGSNATFTVIADGSATLSYQWRMNGTNLSSATANSLMLMNVQATNAADYDVVIANSYGSVTSSVATLTVIPSAPFFVTQPQSQTVPAATNVSFTALAMGTVPISYQWQFNGADLPGKTNTSLSLANVQAANAGDYTLVAGNAVGVSTSAVATLVVTPAPPTITLQPVNRTATKGAEVSFNTAASGSEPFAFQWWFSNAPLAGATAATLTLTNIQGNNAGNYFALVTNNYGSATSVTATLTVTPPPGYLWTRTSGGSSTDDGRCVAADALGNVFVAGRFFGSGQFGGTNLVSDGGSSDIFLTRYDSAGNAIWTRQIGGPSTQDAAALALDPSGNVILTGTTIGLTYFDSLVLTNFAMNTTDSFIAKFSPAGDLLWATNSHFASSAASYAAAADGTGNIFVGGYFWGTGFFGTNQLTAVANNDAFVAKLDPSGQFVWVRVIGGAGGEITRGLAVAADGSVAAVGTYASTLTVGPTNLTFTGGSEAFTVKYDANGNLLWSARVSGTGTEAARGVAVDRDGNVLVAGFHGANASFGNQVFTTFTTTGANDPSDAFLVKYSRDGALLWVARGSGPNSDSGYAVVSDLAGNAYLCGTFGSVAASGNSSISFGGTNTLTGNGSFLTMFNTAGDVVWARRLTSTSTDFGPVLARDNAGNVFVTGDFTLTSVFGHQSFAALGGSDVFLSKWSAFDPALPPQITTTASNRSVVAGANVVLNVGVNSVGPVNCQWFFNGITIAGATNFTLILSNVVGSAGGNYSAIVSNPYGSATSAVTAVTVNVEPDFVWTKHFGGAGNDECLAVAADSADDTYVAGYFSGTVDFGGTTPTSLGGEDGFIAKFDSFQNLVWVRQIGGTNDDRATALALDGAGNVIVAGYFTGAPDFGGTNLVSAGSNDVFVAKFDPDGNLLWAQQAGGPTFDAARSVAVYTNGDIAVAGAYQAGAVFGTNTLTGYNKTNSIFVARYDSGGQLLWVRNAGGSSSSQANGVAFDRAGNVYTTGSFISTVIFSTFNLTASSSLDLFLAKYNPSGAALWARRAGGASAGVDLQRIINDEANAVATDAEGNVFVTGYFQAEGAFASNIVATVSTNAADLFVAKYDSAGTNLWVRGAGGVAADVGNAMAVDDAGNVFVTGAFAGPAVFGTNNTAGIGGNDLFVVMYDSAGTFVKVRKAGGAGDDAGLALSLDGRGNALVGGSYSGPAVFGADAIGNGGGRDAVLTKISFYDPDVAPFITTQPPSQAIYFNSNLVASVGVTSGSPLNYQWLFNGAPLTGATNATLRVMNFQYAAAGNYAVVIGNSFGTVTSAVAAVSVEIAPDVVWFNKAGGTGDDQALALVMDANTNLYVAGYFNGTANFTNIAAQTNITLVSTGAADVFLAKYNSAGVLQWAQRAGGASTDTAQAATVDRNGSVLIAGQFSGTAYFGGTSLVSTGLADVFLAKYDGDGNLLWARRLGGTLTDQVTGLATDGAGNIYMSGYYATAINIGGIVLTNSSNNLSNYFIAKFDSAGNVLWARTVIGIGSSTANGLALDASTNVIVTGTIQGTANFSGATLTNWNTSTDGTMFLVKYDRDGSLLWLRRGAGTAVGSGQAVATDAAGNIYATSSRPYPYSSTVYLLSKYDGAGNAIWYRTFSTLSSTAVAASLAIDVSGNVLICGGSLGLVNLEGLPLSNLGFVAKYNALGKPLWVQKLGNWGSRVALDAAGNAYLAGRFLNNAVFGATNTFTSAGGNDAFLVKLGIKPPLAAPQVAVKTVATDAGTTLQLATGGTGPFAYQWRFNGTNLTGATGSSLVLNGVRLTNAGLYSVVVSNASGSSVSAPVAVNVTPKIYSELVGGNLLLSWDGGFTLQSALAPTGPFTDVANASNPLLFDTRSGPQQFFRLNARSFRLAASSQPGGSLALSGNGIPGFNFYLLASTNLVDWTPVSTNVSPINFTDSNAGKFPLRFYRAVLAQ